jgi:hypothetical protein
MEENKQTNQQSLEFVDATTKNPSQKYTADNGVVFCEVEPHTD